MTTQEPIRSERVQEVESDQLNVFLNIALILISLTGFGLIISIPAWIIAALVKTANQNDGIPSAARDGLTRFTGGQPKYIAIGKAHLPDKKLTGTGIAYRDGRLFVLDAGVAAEIPWSRIRSYRWSVEGYDQYTNPGLNPGVSMQAAGMTEEARQQAHRASGIFITTSDIDHPVWHFQTMDVAVCRKWNEILNQMSEGTLPSR